MIHLLGHAFKMVNHGHRVLSATKHVSQATPLFWTQAGSAHKHTTTFWTKVARWGFKFPKK